MFIVIRPALLEDVLAIKTIADANKKELGFLNKTALAEHIEKGWTKVVTTNGNEIIGFVNYWQRKDGWLTIYEICVKPEYRKRGIGAFMIMDLPKPIRLKCTVDNDANKFYERVGFNLIGTVAGRKRELNIWELI